MVCLGNICRSPLAEGILKSQIKEAGLDWSVDSAGTSNWHEGELPDRRSIEVAKNHGIDITDQRSRQIKADDLESFDLVLAMDSSNYQNILRLDPSKKNHHKVELIMNFEKPNYNQNVPDPYWDNDGFEGVYQMLDRACRKIVEKYK